TAEHVLGRDLVEIPWADSVFDRLEQRVLADALVAAEDERVVDLLLRALHAMREPCNDVFGIMGVNLIHVFRPWIGFADVSLLEHRRAIKVEATHAFALDPAAA